MFRSRWRSGSIILPNSGAFFAGASGPCCPDARGRTRGAAPSALPRGEGAPPLRPRGTFPSRGKSPKARQGGTPGPPRGTERKVKHFSLPLPLRFPHPLDRVSATKIDRFATLGWWANRSLFLLKLHRSSHPLLSIRGAAGGFSRGCRGPFYPQPIPPG